MNIGILREYKVPVERRVPLTPMQCKHVQNIFGVNIYVQSSDSRCFTDSQYIDQGIDVVDCLKDCDIILGIKEVPIDLLIDNKTYLYFSHTIKKQEYNRCLLQAMIDRNITMIDYETLRDSSNKRVLGFGRYAGIVGCYNAFLTYGLKYKRYNLVPAYESKGLEDVISQLNNIVLSNEKIVLTGNGKVAHGALEILNYANITEVTPDEFLESEFNFPVFVRIDTLDYNKRIDNKLLGKQDFYKHPDMYESLFMKYARYADIFIAGHFYGLGSPYLFTRKDARSDDFNIKVVADISCDIDGPVASTIRSSTIEEPIYGYNPLTEQEDNFMHDDVIAVMAVDNLPCELPKDSSEDFGNDLINKVFPDLFSNQTSEVIDNGTICRSGKLMDSFLYLEEYLKNI